MRFYTEKLVFQVATNRPYQEGWRWVTLEIPGAQTQILLSPKTGDETPNVPKLVLTVDDVYRHYEDMKNKGVTFTQGPTPASWNPSEVFALFRDSEGNLVMLGSGSEHDPNRS